MLRLKTAIHLCAMRTYFSNQERYHTHLGHIFSKERVTVSTHEEEASAYSTASDCLTYIYKVPTSAHLNYITFNSNFRNTAYQ